MSADRTDLETGGGDVLPCPSCGSANARTDGTTFVRWVACFACDMSGPSVEDGNAMKAEADAIAAWNRIAALALPTDSAVTGLRELRRIVNARLQTKAINRDRAQAAGRETVAQCRQSDVETLEWVLSEIDQIGATAAATRETRMEAQP